MEANEIKSLWEDYNQKISHSLKLNEQLLKKITQKSSQKEMRGILKWDYINLLGTIILIPLIIMWTILLSHTPLYLISGTISALFFIMYLILYIQKSKQVAMIDFYKDPVIKLQKSMVKYEKYHSRIKKIELLTFPIVIFSLAPIFLKITRSQYIFSIPTPQLIGSLLIGLSIGYIVIFWLYKYFYGEKLKNINSLIRELEEFEEK